MRADKHKRGTQQAPRGGVRPALSPSHHTPQYRHATPRPPPSAPRTSTPMHIAAARPPSPAAASPPSTPRYPHRQHASPRLKETGHLRTEAMTGPFGSRTRPAARLNLPPPLTGPRIKPTRGSGSGENFVRGAEGRRGAATPNGRSKDRPKPPKPRPPVLGARAAFRPLETLGSPLSEKKSS